MIKHIKISFDLFILCYTMILKMRPKRIKNTKEIKIFINFIVIAKKKKIDLCPE